ncbi:MAG: hypothetical protein EXR72_25520 [Myxococcales bacterium]|nr:hypothetical protein [Myxococcales bacterium]
MRLGACLAIALAGCGMPPPPLADAGPARQILVPAGSQVIGLVYGQVEELSARLSGETGAPAPGGEVRFRIFGDPAGSTLSRDRAVADEAGALAVRLTAGSAEASFRVVASAEGADEIEWSVAVSRFAFVELDARLAWTKGPMDKVTTLRALLYDDRSCAQLPPSGTPQKAAREQAQPIGTPTPLRFPTLRAMSYALVGRAEDGAGRLFGAGCVDIAAGLLPPGGQVEVALPLARVVPSVSGAWTVVATVPVVVKSSPVKAWQALVACPRAPAQQILDTLVTALAAQGQGALAAAVNLKRGPVDGADCRPLHLAPGGESLDGQLETLLTPKDAPALALGAVVADLDAIVGQAAITSRLELAPGGDELEAAHSLSRVGFAGALGTHPASYDLAAIGAPVIARRGIRATLDGPALAVASHGFTLRLPSLWGRALGDVALSPRKLPATTRALLAAIVGAAQRTANIGGVPTKLTGCAAIKDLVCTVTGALMCDSTGACESGLDALAATLDQPFAPPSGIDLSWAGTASATDGNGDLVADALQGGSFSAQVVIAKGILIASPVTWTAQRAK